MRLFTLEESHRMVFASAMPLGDQFYTAEEKRVAVVMMVRDGSSLHNTRREMRKVFGKSFPRQVLNRWSSGFETRVLAALKIERELTDALDVGKKRHKKEAEACPV